MKKKRENLLLQCNPRAILQRDKHLSLINSMSSFTLATNIRKWSVRNVFINVGNSAWIKKSTSSDTRTSDACCFFNIRYYQITVCASVKIQLNVRVVRSSRWPGCKWRQRLWLFIRLNSLFNIHLLFDKCYLMNLVHGAVVFLLDC